MFKVHNRSSKCHSGVFIVDCDTLLFDLFADLKHIDRKWNTLLP